MAVSKEDVLQDLGLSVNEAKVYVSLLNLGATTAGKIAEKCKLHRTNVYDALERLAEKGLASYILKDETKIFEASDPALLSRLIEERREKLETVMPQLMLDKQLSKKTTVQVYEGVKAFKLALYNLLKYKKPICIYGLPKHAPEMVKSFIDLFHKTRIERKIVMKHIYNENAQERIAYLNSLAYTEAKYLPHQFDTPISTVTCGCEVLIVYWLEPLTFIRIESQQLADTYKKYFEVLYSTAEMRDSHNLKQKTS
ncbi:MAG: helix-turn-helix domain-containing protein [Candidatus Woesearchaeota archaeon]